MPVINLPNQSSKKWNISYYGDYFGDITDAFNIDLSEKGRIKTSPRTFAHTLLADTLGMEVPTDFVLTNVDGVKKYWMVSDKIYNAATTVSAFTADATTSSPTGLTDSDLIIGWRNATNTDVLFTGTGTDVAKLELIGSTLTWTTNYWTGTLAQPSLNATYPICFAQFNRIVVMGNANFLHYFDNTGTNTGSQYSEVAFNTEYHVNWIKTTKDRIYLGLVNNTDANLPSLIAEYDFLNKTVNRVMEVDSGATIGVVKNNALWIINSLGAVGYYDGSQIVYYTSCPFPTYNKREAQGITLPHRNGIDIIGDQLHFLMPSKLPWIYGGVWCFDALEQQTYHRFSPSYSTTDTLDYGAPEVLVTGALMCLGSKDQSNLFLGAKIYTNNLTPKRGVFSLVEPTGSTVTNESSSYITTSRFNSTYQDSLWKEILINYEPNNGYYGGVQTGEIIAKYRNKTYLRAFQVVTGTWSTNVKFTIASSSFTGVSVGDEVFIVSGDGAGGVANITQITGTTTKTVTIDYPVVSSPTGQFRLFTNNWTEISPFALDATKDEVFISIPTKQSSWVQFRIVNNDFFQIEGLQIGLQVNKKLETQ